MATRDAAAASGAAGAPRRRRAARWATALVAALLVAALAAGAAAVAWLARTPSGTAWLLARLPGIEVVAPRGALLGGDGFAAQRVTVALAGDARIVADGLHWRGLTLHRATQPAGWLRVAIDTLRIERLEWQAGDAAPAAPPPQPPASLALPVELDVGRVEIGAIHAAALGARPIESLRARLSLGAETGARHRIDDIAADWDRLALHGALAIGAAAPFDVTATLTARPRTPAASGAHSDDPAATPPTSATPPVHAAPLPPFELTARAAGPLARLFVDATLRGEPARAGAAPPALDARATLLPFARWPLADLAARTQALDLAALASDAPTTSLTGRADVEATALDAPLRVVVALDNAAAGRWSDGRLPVRALRAELGARLDERDAIELHAFDAQLGSAAQPGGRVHGRGRWQAPRATLALALDGLRPAALDARAPAMRLDGPLELQLDGLVAGGAPRAALQARLAGTLERGTVQLDLDASGSADAVDVRRALLRAGAASATLAGRAERVAGAAWQLRGQATLADFDARAWWPGAEGSAWRDGAQRLNATLDADLRLPAQALAGGAHAQPLVARAAGVRGTASLALHDGSVLAGVPVSGSAALRAAGDAEPAALRLQLDAAGGNRVAVSGRLDRDVRGAADHWDLDATLADLARLAPLLRLAGAPAVAPDAGALDLRATLDGRWPALRTAGQLQARGLRRADARADEAALRWSVGNGAGRSPFAGDDGAPFELRLDAGGLAAGGARVDALHVELGGSAAEHRFRLTAASPLRPPAWAERLLDGAAGTPAAARGVQAELQGRGALSGLTNAAAPAWRGTLERAELRPRHGDAPATASARADGGATGRADASADAAGRSGPRDAAAPWLALRDAALDVRRDGAAWRAEAAGGSAQLAGIALRWDRLRWNGGGARAQFDVGIELEPFAVAPLLARLQPAFGWQGDLVVGGHVRLQRSAGAFAADVELARRGGDLVVVDDAGTLPLALTDLRVALDARDGTWRFTHGLAGATFGATAGAATLRTSPAAAWPPADAPLDGVLEARVANLGAWGAWLPAGWRLGGQLHATAALGGRLGAPEVTGRLAGSGLEARNLLEGIELRDGVLDVALQGTRANIVRAELRAGDGVVRLAGDAELGAAPQARLALTAERARAIGRVDRRVVASGEAALALRADALRLDGRLHVDEGLIDLSREDAPGLGDDVTVLRGDDAAGAAARDAAAAERRRDVALDLRIDLGERLRLRGRGIDTALRGELRLTSPQGRLAVDGSVRTVEGTFAAYGQKLTIERGIVAFNGPPSNPRLDIVAVRPATDIRVGVAIGGSAAAPRVRLFSEPEMSETDKLSWLVLGRASEGLGRTDTAVLQRAALALIAGNDSEGPAANLTRLIGLDEMSVRQSDGTVRETIVTLGKQLSARWYVGYERGLNATAGTWQLIYRVAQRFTLRAQSGLDNALDAIWTWRWQ